MSIQKLHYENLGGMLIRRDGLLNWRCPLCKAEGQSLEVMRACPECGSKEATLPGAQLASNAVAYLDLGVGGYMDIGTDLTDEELAALPKGRHMLGVIGTYGADGYVPAQPAPSVPEGWLRAIDEALVVAHLGVANVGDTYEQAKAKLDSLIGFHVDVATDPAVNGGWKLVPVAPTKKMIKVCTYMLEYGGNSPQYIWAVMLAATPEAKP